MSYFDLTTWRAFTKEEMLTFLASLRQNPGDKKKNGPKKRGSNLIIQKMASPFDIYTYLHARFGPPNGLQTFLARDDSDNLFHWDYYLKAAGKSLTFTGAAQEVHVWFNDNLSDAECLKFIENLKVDFRRVGRSKREFAATLEKWNIFPNQYLSIAERCADLYESIETALPKVNRAIFGDNFSYKNLQTHINNKTLVKLITRLTTAPTELAVLMPVMFESFIGLLISGLIKPELKQNQRMFESFRRSPLDIKIMDLANRCKGFKRPIDYNNPSFSRYRNIINKRNDIIHGNIDPSKDVLYNVYFHNKIPIYKSGGDRIQQYFISLLDQYKPQQVLEDYIATHDFIAEILGHLEPQVRESLLLVMGDSQPGWDEKRNIFGHLFPHRVVTSYFEGMRYDWDLRAE